MVLQCNSTLAELVVHEDPLFPAHSDITFHGFGIGLSAIFGLISVLISFYLIFRHATHYLVDHGGSMETARLQLGHAGYEHLKTYVEANPEVGSGDALEA